MIGKFRLQIDSSKILLDDSGCPEERFISNLAPQLWYQAEPEFRGKDSRIPKGFGGFLQVLVKHCLLRIISNFNERS